MQKNKHIKHNANNNDKDFSLLKFDKWGLRIDSSIIWLDTYFSPEINVLCSLEKNLNNNSKYSGNFFLSSGTMALLNILKKKSLAKYLSLTDPIICDYNNSFEFGSYQIEFRSTGCTLGNSIVHFSSKNCNLLYAPNPTINLYTIFGSCKPKECESLYLHSYIKNLDDCKSFNKINCLDSVVDYCDSYFKAHNKYPTIICDKLGAAQELCYVFQKKQIKLLIHRSIADINKIYKNFGYDLADHTTIKDLSKKTLDNNLVMLPKNLFLKKNKILPIIKDIIFIASDISSYQKANITQNYAKVFFINQYSQIDDIDLTIDITKPKKLYIGGYHALHYKETLKKHNIQTKIIFPKNHPTLFDLARS